MGSLDQGENLSAKVDILRVVFMFSKIGIEDCMMEMLIEGDDVVLETGSLPGSATIFRGLTEF